MDLQLDERKEKILNAIIKNYLETGEPVGSRTISKYTDLNLSSATIRNEMSDLEEMGYIVQPHTSAGRIPSDMGYRFYVDHLIAAKDQEVLEMQEMMIEKTEKMEHLLQQVAKVLANNTQYTTMITAPSAGNRLKFIQLSHIDDKQVLSVVVMEGNIVKNKMIQVDKPLDNETMLKLNMLLNTTLNGLTVNEINLGLIAKLKEQAGIHDEIISQVLDSLAETIKGDDSLEVYTSGATNIFKYPELSDTKQATQLFTALEDKKTLAEMLHDKDDISSENGIQVYIGDESPLKDMKDCSVVTATYELGEGVRGTIGIIGPKRMDYENVMDNIRSLKGQLDKILKKGDD